jgi:hypothetical protein
MVCLFRVPAVSLAKAEGNQRKTGRSSSAKCKETPMTINVSGMATAQYTHCDLFKARMSVVFIPKMPVTKERGRNMTVTMVKA